MSWLKFSIMLSTGALLVALSSSAARSQDAGPPPQRSDGSDNGPMPGGPPGRMGERRAQPPRDDGNGPPGPPEMRGDRPQPPDGAGPRRPREARGDDRSRPGPMDGPRGPGDKHRPRGGPEGERLQPPEGPGGPDGPPPPGGPEGGPHPPGLEGFPPRGRHDFEMLKSRDPELFKAMQEDRELERATRDLADEFRRIGKDDQAKIKEKLIETVGKHFEVRQQLRNLEVKRLEQQLKQLREKVEQRTKNRKEIVDKRITELTGADEGERF